MTARATHKRRAARAASLRDRAPAPKPAPDVVPEALRAIWEQHRADAFERVALLERAAASLSAGALADGERAEAQRSAHALHGTLGTFGFARASKAAAALELELEQTPLERAAEIAVLVATVRRELQHADSDGAAGSAAVPERSRGAEVESAQILLVDGDLEFCGRIAAACAARGVRCEVASTVVEARARCAANRPDAVLIDLVSAAQDISDSHELLSELSSGEPPIPTFVLTASDAFTDRVEAARRGSRAFLPKSLPPAEVLSAVEELRARDRLATTRVLVVDDDPAMLDATRELLRPHDVELFTLDDPLRFWEVLEEVRPELVILDVAMPGVNGIELCKTVRNDPHWSGVAIIFITAKTDAETIEAVFNAGADDYIPKPIVGPELVTRVSNRLERVRLYRAQAERDGLTGLSNRTTTEEGLSQLAELSDRFGEPLCVAMLDLDRFKLINDTYGHAAGDSVLRRLGERMQREFRGNDVVGRWGGEEFVVGMYGMARSDGVKRFTDFLARFGAEQFEGRDGPFTVSFSVGIAEYPSDADTTDSLLRTADEALYRAKEAGRARVLGPLDAADAPARAPAAGRPH
jgi:diguanylate cyclase (GGDEF)-like protein